MSRFTSLFHDFRLEGERVSHENLLLGHTPHHLVALGAGVLAAVASAQLVAESVVLEALTVEFQASGAGAVAVFRHIVNAGTVCSGFIYEIVENWRLRWLIGRNRRLLGQVLNLFNDFQRFFSLFNR